MMFDFYGIIGFKEKVDLSRLKNPFLKYELYNGLSFREEVIQTARAKFFRLEREGSYKSHFYKDQEHLFLFGFVFSSKEYESLTGKKPKRLSIKEVFELYKEYGGSIVRYVKGSFVLIMYNERVNKVLCISDQLNVLPIFYAYKKGLFIFSSAIKPILDSGFVDTDIDKMAIVEFAIFDYSLRDKTYYRDIKRLDYGMVLEADKKGLKKDRYFTVDRLFSERLMGDKESLEELGNLLHENVNLYASDAKRFSLSLTGGFDGRANLALLDRPAEDFLCFSYGMPGSRQINIPLEISKRLNLNYRPIYLDEKFEEQYEDNAIRAVFYSDGTAPILSANYPYSCTWR